MEILRPNYAKWKPAQERFQRSGGVVMGKSQAVAKVE